MIHRNFRQAFGASYAGGSAFVLACPMLALVPAAFEMLQHVVEVHAGLYEVLAAAQAEDDPARLRLGFAKTLAMTVSVYWVVRFLWRRDPAWARRAEPAAVHRFAGYLAFQAAFLALGLFVVPRTGAGETATAVLGILVSALTPAWGAAAALGSARIGPLRSIRLMARQLPWTLAFTLAVLLPTLVPHYALGVAAMFVPSAALWPVLALDAALVGWMAAVVAAGGLQTALRAADHAGVALAADADPPARGSGDGAALDTA